MNLPQACPHCSSPVRITPIDGGGVVVAYSCTAEYVVERKGAVPRQVRACPEPRYTSAVRAAGGAGRIVEAERQLLQARGDKK